MDQERWQKIESIVDEVLSIDETEQRETYLKNRCGNDTELRYQVSTLLKFIQKAKKSEFLER